jgi:hypoxanthine-DNA glycosylase
VSYVESFPPIVSHRSKVVILGSMPGARSLQAGEYYAHPRNAFWPIMGALFGADRALPYAERLRRLDSAGVALWDSLQACIRPGSLDSSIRDDVGNDFGAFFAAYPNITHVFFNGQKAETVFRRRFHAFAFHQPGACRGVLRGQGESVVGRQGRPGLVRSASTARSPGAWRL